MNTPICPTCRDRGVIVTTEFDGRTAHPCPSCQQRDPFERARAELARGFTSDPRRQPKRPPMRSPR